MQSNFTKTADKVDVYLQRGIKSIDDIFGDGYSKSHPELLVGYLQCCMEDHPINTISQTGDVLSSESVAEQKSLRSCTNIRTHGE